MKLLPINPLTTSNRGVAGLLVGTPVTSRYLAIRIKALNNRSAMRLFEDFGETLLALVMASAAAILAAIVTWVSVIWLGVRLLTGEASYGPALGLGPLLALLAAIVAFIFVFRKMRITG